mgnify:CR=1 FL=1
METLFLVKVDERVGGTIYVCVCGQVQRNHRLIYRCTRQNGSLRSRKGEKGVRDSELREVSAKLCNDKESTTITIY